MRQVTFPLTALLGLLVVGLGCKEAAHKSKAGAPAPAVEESSEPGAGEPKAQEPSIEDCGSLAKVACAKLDECAPFFNNAYYGSAATCESVLGEICEGLSASNTPPSFARCQASLSCTSVVEARGVPAFCWNPAGAVPEGGSCLRDTDCEEGLCLRGKSEDHGTCGAPKREGQDCALPARCELGLRCDVTSGSCTRGAGLGSKCDSPFGCEAGLICGAEGKCEATVVGTACVTGILPCTPGQSCVFDACAASPISEGSCKDPSTECAGTLRCVVQQLATFEQLAECQETGRFDAECDLTTPCIEPLSCRGGRCAP
jgi:hypothetical protein